MITTTITRRTELAHRTSDGLDVYLFWNEPTDLVTVSVRDSRSEERFGLEVEAHLALDAFNHPFCLRSLEPHRRFERSSRRFRSCLTPPRRVKGRVGLISRHELASVMIDATERVGYANSVGVESSEFYEASVPRPSVMAPGVASLTWECGVVVRDEVLRRDPGVSNDHVYF
jgi:hypothetical protein